MVLINKSLPTCFSVASCCFFKSFFICMPVSPFALFMFTSVFLVLSQ